MDQPDAYSLLSRPTLELTDDEVEIVVQDLRRRRDLFVKTGKPDKAKADSAKAKAIPVDEAQKAANTKALLAQLKIFKD